MSNAVEVYARHVPGHADERAKLSFCLSRTGFYSHRGFARSFSSVGRLKLERDQAISSMVYSVSPETKGWRQTRTAAAIASKPCRTTTQLNDV